MAEVDLEAGIWEAGSGLAISAVGLQRGLRAARSGALVWADWAQAAPWAAWRLPVCPISAPGRAPICTLDRMIEGSGATVGSETMARGATTETPTCPIPSALSCIDRAAVAFAPESQL
jgi:hypothetical protein